MRLVFFLKSERMLYDDREQLVKIVPIKKPKNQKTDKPKVKDPRKPKKSKAAEGYGSGY